MPQASKSGTKSAKSPDAIQLLTAEHKEVDTLFKEYEKLAEKDGSDEEKETLARQICLMLTVHATTEEEIFYPAAREALDDEDLLDEAEVEHASAKDLIAQIESGSPSDPLYDAKVKVLGEYIRHHVKEEEREIFPLARKTKLDLKALGAILSEEKDALMRSLA